MVDRDALETKVECLLGDLILVERRFTLIETSDSRCASQLRVGLAGGLLQTDGTAVDQRVWRPKQAANGSTMPQNACRNRRCR